jgi:hypothetical protein
MTNKNSSTGVAPRCQFHFSDGRCCRMLRSPAHSSFCAFHARQQLQLLESQRLGGEISTSLNGNFLTATDINHVLGKLFTAVAQNRISLRKAANLTWSRKLNIHPHVHCVVPAGGLSLDRTHWVRSPENYFLPKPVLRKVFRGKFVDALKQAFQNGQLNFHGDLKLLAQPNLFAAWLRPLYRQDWVVYLKRPFGGPAYVLQYLGRYTHRVAISNHRLVSLVDGQVTFRWRDSADHNKQKLLTLAVDEFLRRFLLHLLPKGFVRIRNFGFLANRKRATLQPLCFQLLGAAQEPQAEQHASSTEDFPDLWRCPKCGGPMKVVERLTAS